MLIFLSTSFIIILNKSSFYSHLMKPHICISYSNPDDYITHSNLYGYYHTKSPLPIHTIMSKRAPDNSVVTYTTYSSPKLHNTELKPTKMPKSHYLHTLSVEDAQQEKRNRILRQKSSTETSGLGSSLDYTSADDLNNRSTSNSRRHSSTSNTVLETKVIYSRKTSPVPVTNRKVSWRTLPNQSINTAPITRGFSRSENFTLETIESSGSSHANNDHSTPQSLTENEQNIRAAKQITKYKNADLFQETDSNIYHNYSDWIFKQNTKQRTYYNSELDFGTMIYNSDETDDSICPLEHSHQHSDTQTKRKSFNSKTCSFDSSKVKWCNWSKERRAESAKRTGSDFCQALQISTNFTKTINYTELQSLLPNACNPQGDQYSTNTNSNYADNASPSTSHTNNQLSCNDTMQMSAGYFAEMSQKKDLGKKRRDEENRLTHEQIHYLVEYWDHDIFVRLRSWALCFSLLAVALQIFVGLSGSWSLFGDTHHPNYSGLWMTCIPRNHTCTFAFPFTKTNNGYRDSILCLVAVSSIFSIGGSGLSFTGLCVTALARKLYYYHSAGEIFFVSGMTMTLAVSLYSISVEFHLKFHKHRYGYTFWLAWVSAALLLLSALNLLMDELIQGSTKLRGCSCLAKCFKCWCCCKRSQSSSLSSEARPHTYHESVQPHSIRRNHSRISQHRRPINGQHSRNNLESSQLNNNTTSNNNNNNNSNNNNSNKSRESATQWMTENDIEEDFV